MTDAQRSKPEVDFPEGEAPTDLVVEDLIEGDGAQAGAGDVVGSTAREIAEAQEKGQPVLVGTTSIEKSELISSLLKKRGIE